MNAAEAAAEAAAQAAETEEAKQERARQMQEAEKIKNTLQCGMISLEQCGSRWRNSGRCRTHTVWSINLIQYDFICLQNTMTLFETKLNRAH